MIVTHDLGLAWTVADRVAVMYLGRVVEIGPDRGGTAPAAAPVHEGPAGCRARRRAAPTDRSCRASRRTRRASRRAAGSTRAARSWRRDAPRSSGIEERCKGEDLALAEAGRTTTSRRVTWWSSTSSRRLLRPRPSPSTSVGSASASSPRSTPRIAAISASPTGASCLAPVRADASSARRLASAISARPSSSRERSASARARRSASSRADLGVAGFLPELPHLGAELGVLPAELDQLVGHRPSEVGVGRAGAARRPRAAPRLGTTFRRGRRPIDSRSPGSSGRASSSRYEPFAGSRRRRAINARTARAVDSGSGRSRSRPISAGVSCKVSPTATRWETAARNAFARWRLRSFMGGNHGPMDPNWLVARGKTFGSLQGKLHVTVGAVGAEVAVGPARLRRTPLRARSHLGSGARVGSSGGCS